ncbi:MAG: hypothetical protein ABL308_03620 [Oceanicaulis sp.]
MRQYLPLLFEGLIAGAVVLWGVWELYSLRRDKARSDKDAEPGSGEDGGKPD